MQSNWAADHLQVIRTLMERSAVYRRALAPIMLLLGALGLAAAISGYFLPVQSSRAFGWYWMAVGLIGISGAYMMVRRQALNEGDFFWSPPTRRVTQAALPSLFAGMMAGVLFTFSPSSAHVSLLWLPAIWMVLYGCAVHAAGFFMPRGMKLFGWGFVAAGSVVGMLALLAPLSDINAHVLMGSSFGVFHLGYGVYLYFTERRKNGV